MSLLQVTKGLIVLHKSVELGLLTSLRLLSRMHGLLEVSQDLRCRVELDASSCTLLVPLENHVRDNLQLRHTLKLQLRLELFDTEGAHREVIVLPIGAAEVDLFFFVATPLDCGTHTLDYDDVLWSWLYFFKYVLAGQLDASLGEAGQVRRLLLQVDVLVSHVVLDQQVVFDVFEDLDLLKLLLLIGFFVLDEALPLSFSLRLVIYEADLVYLANVVLPETLCSAFLLQMIAEVKDSFESSDEAYITCVS